MQVDERNACTLNCLLIALNVAADLTRPPPTRCVTAMCSSSSARCAGRSPLKCTHPQPRSNICNSRILFGDLEGMPMLLPLDGVSPAPDQSSTHVLDIFQQASEKCGAMPAALRPIHALSASTRIRQLQSSHRRPSVFFRRRGLESQLRAGFRMLARCCNTVPRVAASYAQQPIPALRP